MGISTYQSYCGAQIFRRGGLGKLVSIDKHFTGTATTIEGADPPRHRRRSAGPPRAGRAAMTRSIARCWMSAATMRSGCAAKRMPGRRRPSPGYSMRARGNSAPDYKAFADIINDQSERLLTIRGLMKFKPVAEEGAARRDRACERDRQALRDRGDELWLYQPRGAHDAGDRDEPHRRQVEHRRGRRRGGAVQADAQR